MTDLYAEASARARRARAQIAYVAMREQVFAALDRGDFGAAMAAFWLGVPTVQRWQ